MFATGKDLFIAGNDGSAPRELVSLPGRVASLEPSPDGKRVLLQLDMKGNNFNELETFEVAVDGTGVKKIRDSSPDECCFHWSWDGNYLLYSLKAGNRWDIWALPAHAGFFRTSTKPIRLTTGPLSFSGGAIPSRDGKQIFAVASKQRGELLRYDLKLHQFVPLLSGISATDATFSDDGKWVAYLSYPDHSVWRSRSDGAERMQLTFPPVEALNPFISPDGSRVAYTTDSGTFLVDINGGTAKKIYQTSQNPMWSPDGKSILITILSGGVNYSMQMIDTGTARASLVRASEGKGGGFWLDQKTLLAANATQTKLQTLDVDSGKWTDFFTGSPADWINSPDRKYVYIATGGAEPMIQRIRVSDRVVETIVSLKDFAELSNYGWIRLRVAPDGSPTLTRALDTQEIYTLQVRRP
jgi:Tol biopolymer transport system component